MLTAPLLLLGCALPVCTVPPATAADAPAEPGIAWAPPPHSIEELRAGLPAGTVIRLRTTSSVKATTEERLSVVQTDEHGTLLRSELYSEHGERIEDLGVEHLRWSEWQDRSRLPAGNTTHEASSVKVAAGSFETSHYTATYGETVQHFHYAKEAPGPPVLSTMVADGVEASRVELLDRRIDPALAASVYVPPTRVKGVKPAMPPAMDDPAVGSARCIVDLRINESGAVMDVKTVKCVPGTEENSVAAAKLWVFTPATLDGVPLPSPFRLVFNFNLSP